MAIVERLSNVLAALRSRAARIRRDKRVVVAVGYATAYALVQHERLDFSHTVGQAKYLEEPARTKQREILGAIVNAYKGNATFSQAMIVGGLRLQRESIPLVPVDTGALRNSSFVKLER